MNLTSLYATSRYPPTTPPIPWGIFNFWSWCSTHHFSLVVEIGSFHLGFFPVIISGTTTLAPHSHNSRGLLIHDDLEAIHMKCPTSYKHDFTPLCAECPSGSHFSLSLLLLFQFRLYLTCERLLRCARGYQQSNDRRGYSQLPSCGC